uniref:Glycosyltransferase 61 catalytic domain-containing protein n=1 Tax=Amphora coffeiformis TaxID=265554 RepID=A0A7S3P5K1_9STRA
MMTTTPLPPPRKHRAGLLLVMAAVSLVLYAGSFLHMMVQFHLSIEIQGPTTMHPLLTSPHDKVVVERPQPSFPKIQQREKELVPPAQQPKIDTDNNKNDNASPIEKITQPQSDIARKPPPTLPPWQQPQKVANHDTTNHHHLNTSSTVTALSRGMDRYTHVCLKRVPGRHLELRTYYAVDDAPPRSTKEPWRPYLNATQLSSIPDAKPNYFEWILQSHGYPAATQWEDDIQRASLYVTASQGPTVLTFDIFQNPGHCLSDMIWSLALDRYERHPQSTSAATSMYPHFIWADRDTLDPTVDYSQDWCLQFLHATGWFGPRWEQAATTSSSSPNVCFDELWVPAFSLFRFPLQTTAQVKTLRKYSFMWKNMRTHDFSSQWSWSYPVQALEETRTAVTQSLGLSSEPWPATTTDNTTISMIFLDRLGNARRQWKNAQVVREALQRQYPRVRVQVVHDDTWRHYTFRQQATLFHRASHIVAVHAGAQANLIFCRPGTQVVELACLGKWDPGAQSNLTTIPADATENVAWQGPTGWYSSFTRPLGLHHYILSDALTCTLGKVGRIHDAAELVADVNMTVRFLASRMGL